MRDPASEKAEIIELVAQASLPVKRTVEKLGIPLRSKHAFLGARSIDISQAPGR